MSDSIFDADDRKKMEEPPTEEELAFWQRVIESDAYIDALDEMRLIYEVRRLRALVTNVPCHICNHDPERGRPGAD